MVITEETSIWELVKAGVMPEWMARECDIHGMDRAEYVLNEYDWEWEWDWDLGMYYNEEQTGILKQVRKTIREGIEAFRSNPELVRQHKERKALEKRRYKLIEQYRKDLLGYVEPEDVRWIADYAINHDTLPYLYILTNKLILGFEKLTDRQKARLLQIGLPSGEPVDADKVGKQFPDLPKSIFSWKNCKIPWEPVGKLKQFIEAVSFDTPVSEDSSVWHDIMESQHIKDISSIQIMRMITSFRYDYRLETSDDGKLILASCDQKA